MQTQSVNSEEKLINNILFIYILGVAICGFSFVMLFLHGGIRECIFLLTGLFAIITKLFEKPLGKNAKYVYACIPPVIGAITAAVCNTNTSDSYVCLTHYYFVATLLLVPYYSQKLLRVSTAVTMLANLVLMILFPAGFLKLHSIIAWVFIGIVYMVLFAACSFIVYRTTVLFKIVEDQGHEAENVLHNVQAAFDSLEGSSETIYNSLQEFEGNTEEIAASTQQINESADLQINEVENSLTIFNELDDKIVQSEDRVNQTVETIKNLRAKNDEGFAVIHALSEKFEENIKTTQTAADGVEELSRKSSSISGIIESIREIAQQTNLLALNAAIEAARAGEAGKGFSVVALEIQKLAEQTNNSAKKIEEIVLMLVSNTEYSVSVMEQVKKNMEEQSSDVSDTQGIFGELEENILASTEKINSISEMTAKIDNVKQDMTNTIEEFSEQAENNASAIEETSAMASQLADEFAKVSQLASQLQQLALQMDENIAFFH